MRNPLRILIVDDDPRMAKNLSDLLHSKGYTNAIAATGREALDMIKEDQVAVSLIDLRLEDMSGLEVMKEIKKCSRDTECIFLAGDALQTSAAEAVSLGAYS